jgi:hypothetical protein
MFGKKASAWHVRVPDLALPFGNLVGFVSIHECAPLIDEALLGRAPVQPVGSGGDLSDHHWIVMPRAADNLVADTNRGAHDKPFALELPAQALVFVSP